MRVLTTLQGIGITVALIALLLVPWATAEVVTDDGTTTWTAQPWWTRVVEGDGDPEPSIRNQIAAAGFTLMTACAILAFLAVVRGWPRARAWGIGLTVAATLLYLASIETWSGLHAVHTACDGAGTGGRTCNLDSHAAPGVMMWLGAMLATLPLAVRPPLPPVSEPGGMPALPDQHDS